MTEIRRVRRADLEAAISPSVLEDVLSSLQGAGIISGWELRGAEVLVSGALGGLQRALERADMSASHAPHVGLCRVEYFEAAREFMGTAAFSEWPPRSQNIWRLHAEGESHADIAQQMRVGRGVVRYVLRACRADAGLPEPENGPRIGGNLGGRPRLPEASCMDRMCRRRAKARGLCRIHYLRAWRNRRPRQPKMDKSTAS